MPRLKQVDIGPSEGYECTVPGCRNRAISSGDGYRLPFCRGHLEQLPRKKFERLCMHAKGSVYDDQDMRLASEAWVLERRTQLEREAWRRVLLVTKAKLEIVAEGDSTIEREFLADLLLPDGQTVHQALAEGIQRAYTTGDMPPLLPGS